MAESNPYRDFTRRLKLLIRKHPALITMTLSNIFTMRLIGNKTHGDLAEIAISEFVNQYMYDFTSTHVGKDLYRAKSKEEDISIRNDMTQKEMLVSLKAYGVGPLQLSTDKSARMFPRLLAEGDDVIQERERIQEWDDPLDYLTEMVGKEDLDEVIVLTTHSDETIVQTGRQFIEAEIERREMLRALIKKNIDALKSYLVSLKDE